MRSWSGLFVLMLAYCHPAVKPMPAPSALREVAAPSRACARLPQIGTKMVFVTVQLEQRQVDIAARGDFGVPGSIAFDSFRLKHV